jgi:hypothetical protein
MYKIGCNWSWALHALITKNQVNIDYIKTGAFGDFDECFDTMRALKPVLLHGLGHYETAGMEKTDAVDFERARRFITACGSPHYAMHLAVRNVDISTDMSPDDIFARIAKNITIFKKNIPVQLLVENIADTPQEVTLYDHYPFAEPEKISRVVKDNDMDMILDLTHAKITAMYRNWDIYDYLQALPLHRVREIHVNGSGYDTQGFPDDTHHAMEEVDKTLLTWVLQYTKPNIITLEYLGVPGEQTIEITENLIKQLTFLNSLNGG